MHISKGHRHGHQHFSCPVAASWHASPCRRPSFCHVDIGRWFFRPGQFIFTCSLMHERQIRRGRVEFTAMHLLYRGWAWTVISEDMSCSYHTGTADLAWQSPVATAILLTVTSLALVAATWLLVGPAGGTGCRGNAGRHRTVPLRDPLLGPGLIVFCRRRM